MARAAIAEANYKKFLEGEKAKNCPENEESWVDFAMEAISNHQRNILGSVPVGVGNPSRKELEELGSTSQVNKC